MKNNLLTSTQHKALCSLGIEELNAMQLAALEQCRKLQSMVLLSPTGSGKTLAYLLPLLERLDDTVTGVQAVVVVPSRELAVQIAGVWRSMNTSFRMVALYGGRPMNEEVSVLRNSYPSVVVGTPGRLIDHLRSGNLVNDVCRLLVIDEFDKCLEMGFCDEMQQLLALLPSVDSRFLLSATNSDKIPDFAGVDAVAPLDFRVLDELPSDRITFYKLTTTPDERLHALFELLCVISDEPVIVFCNFRESVDEVRSYLAKQGLVVSAYHGALEQKERELALYRFTARCSNILVSTDLAARGLDIDGVRHVVHFQRPMTEDIYVHRNGRTARWDAGGNVYFVSYENRSLPSFIPEDIAEFRISKRLTMPEPSEWAALYIGKGKRDKISRGDIAGFFMKKANLHREELGSIVVFDRYSYAAVRRCRMRETLRLVAGEKIKGVKTIIEPVRGR